MDRGRTIRDSVDALLHAERAAAMARDEVFTFVYALTYTLRSYDVPGSYVPRLSDDPLNRHTLRGVYIGPRGLDGPDYLHVNYVYSGGDDSNEVLQYPMALVENPTREALAEYIESERRAAEERQREEKRKSAARLEAREREALQRLKAKYEK